MDLKTETIGLAVMLELPMVDRRRPARRPVDGHADQDRAADLLQALYGRHGESPLPVVAASTPAQCFDAAIEAARIAVTYRTPVILLTDTFLANSSRAVEAARRRPTLPEIDPRFAHRARRRRRLPALRARRERSRGRGRSPARPGLRAPDRRAGEGGRDRRHLLRRPRTTTRMTELRAAKVARRRGPDLAVDGDGDAELLVLGWGSSYGAIRAAARRLRASAADASPPRTCTTSTRCPPTRRGAALLRARAGARR